MNSGLQPVRYLESYVKKVPAELPDIFMNSLNSYQVDRKKLIGYATRRNKKEVINSYLNLYN